MYARGRQRGACYNVALREMRESYAVLEVAVRLRYISPLPEQLERRNDAQCVRRFEAGQRLPRRRRRGLIARLAVAPAQIRAFGNIERHRDERTFELIGERVRTRSQGAPMTAQPHARVRV